MSSNDVRGASRGWGGVSSQQMGRFLRGNRYWVRAIVSLPFFLIWLHASTVSANSRWSKGELGQQAADLKDNWGKEGQVERLPPRLLNRGDLVPIAISPELLNPKTPGCVTVGVLSTPNLSFLMVFGQNDQKPNRRAWPVPSAAGAAEVTRCGARKPLLQGLTVQLRSRRGILEFLVLASEHPPAPISEVLQGRDAGPSIPSPQVGKRPWLAPVKERTETRKQILRAHGATRVTTSASMTNDSGRGDWVVHLNTGCHRLELLTGSHQDSPPDLDARLQTLTTAENLDIDEEHSGQAALEYCVGRPERFRVSYSGARPKSEVVVIHSEWALPVGLPLEWGAQARANLARAIWQTDFPPLKRAPLQATLGVRGTTAIPLEIDPQSCYVAVVAPFRGKTTRFGIASQTRGMIRQAQSLKKGRGVAVHFCAQGARSTRIEIQAVGSGLAWIFGLWATTHAPPTKFIPGNLTMNRRYDFVREEPMP